MIDSEALLKRSDLAWMGQNTTHLEPPAEVVAALLDSTRRHEFQWYAPALGFTELRELIGADLGLPGRAVMIMADAVRQVRGAEPELKAASWLGDTASFGAKVPTVIFGPGGEPVYCPDEHLSVADIVEATQVYASFAALALARPGD